MTADPISAALDHVMGRFAGMLRAAGRRRGLTDVDLDELIQDVRVRLWRALAEREKIEVVQASYVYSAAVSAALDMIRRRRSKTEEPLAAVRGMRVEDSAVHSPVVAAPERPDLELERRELGRRIDRAIDELASPRDVVVRLHLSGYTRTEIAELLGWTEPKVRNLIYRGLADLREALLREGIGPGRLS